MIEKTYPIRWYNEPYTHSNAYEDCIAHGIHDTEITYAEHTNDICVYFRFLPGQNVFSIHYDFDDMAFKVVGVIRVDTSSKIVYVTQLLLKGIDHYSHMAYRYGGSIKELKKLDTRIGGECSIQRMVSQMFGDGWSVDYKQCKGKVSKHLCTCTTDWFSRHKSHPWSQVVAKFSFEKQHAATRIQSAFRGWKTRMQYRFNPYTTLGRFLVLRMF